MAATSIASVLYYDPIYSLKLTYAIDLLAIEIYAVVAGLSVEAFCRLVESALAEKSEANLARIQRTEAEARLADHEAQIALTCILADREARFRETFENGGRIRAHYSRWPLA